jgi:hypothetical protein
MDLESEASREHVKSCYGHGSITTAKSFEILNRNSYHLWKAHHSAAETDLAYQILAANVSTLNLKMMGPSPEIATPRSPAISALPNILPLSMMETSSPQIPGAPDWIPNFLESTGSIDDVEFVNLYFFACSTTPVNSTSLHRIFACYNPQIL